MQNGNGAGKVKKMGSKSWDTGWLKSQRRLRLAATQVEWIWESGGGASRPGGGKAFDQKIGVNRAENDDHLARTLSNSRRLRLRRSIAAHQLGFGQDMSLHGLFDLVAGRAARQV